MNVICPGVSNTYRCQTSFDLYCKPQPSRPSPGAPAAKKTHGLRHSSGCPTLPGEELVSSNENETAEISEADVGLKAVVLVLGEVNGLWMSKVLLFNFSESSST